MSKRSNLAAAALLVASIGIAKASPRTIEIPEPTAEFKAPKDDAHRAGFDAATGNCMVCHSVDYIATQPPKKGDKFWETEVHKMIKVYKAQIGESDAKIIADYLAVTY
ncbi:cytochrome c [Methylobacterium sp. C25]|uniref:SorB family sulfite dehydrogenase c-type cytochrome subunit n=1 Tax=Methylobacterium sp. C25 TaxID=2721622 RepID=UPI001F300FD2|nr:cytochrome c [Methylobacterium sp. C25]